MTDADKQERARKLIDREVYCTLSHIVATLASGMGERMPKDLADLAEQAYELARPIEDWEEAATEAGWTRYETDKATSGETWGRGDETADSAQEACEQSGVDPYQHEVFEHWIVSDWLGEKLTAKGEKVDTDFGGLTVWARCTTGQAIYIDGVIEQIVAELN